MGIFLSLDHRLDKYSRGWQRTGRNLVAAMQNAINNEQEEVSFLQYDVSGEKRAAQQGAAADNEQLVPIGCVSLLASTRAS
jgi:hypothetical protein